jgi:hypothetical protein
MTARVTSRNNSSLTKSAVLGAFATALALAAASMPAASAMPLAAASSTVSSDNPLISQVRVYRRTGVAVGPNGGVAVRRTTVVTPGFRPVVGAPVRWARPAHYYWGPGGAVAAGAAIGFVAAATAVAWAGAPPAPGMCWYYTDPSRRAGFWDACR